MKRYFQLQKKQKYKKKKTNMKQLQEKITLLYNEYVEFDKAVKEKNKNTENKLKCP